MINVAIIGYGQVGKGVEAAIQQNKDINLVAIFTRRKTSEVHPLFKTKVESFHKLFSYKNKIDVCILCGGSSSDLPKQAPEVLTHFNCVDSFDTHAAVPSYLKSLNTTGKQNNHLAIAAGGWDPGLFSLARLFFDAFLPDGHLHTFWGKGVSQGHSEAIKRIAGIADAVQYTIPNRNTLKLAKSGKNPDTYQKHIRICYVVAKPNADKIQIENQIKTMPHYFAPYKTEVHFITQKEFLQKHKKRPHGGLVLQAHKEAKLQLSIQLKNNPAFTGRILVSLARACFKMAARGITGAKTILDIKPIDISPKKSQDAINIFI